MQGKTNQLTQQLIVDKYNKLKDTFEELLVQHIVLKELRDYYRKRAGLPIPKSQDSNTKN